MPTRTIYVPDSEVSIWDEATEMAKRHNVSISRMIVDNLKQTVRERRVDIGVPLGFKVPASMKDPELLKQEQFADSLAAQVRARVLEHLQEES